MKSGVITQHNKDPGFDKIEPGQLVRHAEGMFVRQRPSEIYEENEGGQIGTSDFILSFCLRGSERGRTGQEWGAVTGWEGEWLAPPVTEIWEEPNLFSMYACSCCQRAVLTSSSPQHHHHHHLFTVHDPPTGTQKPHNSGDCRPH